MKRLFAGSLLALFGIGFGACVENANKTVPPTEASQNQTAAPQTRVVARDYQFTPDVLSMPQGSVSLDLKNEGSQRHSIVIYSDADYKEAIADANTQPLDPGTDRSISFTIPTNAGEKLYFRCGVHPDRMSGVINVAKTSG